MGKTFTLTTPQMLIQSYGPLERPGKDVILENEDDDTTGAFMSRLPLSDAGARPPWHIDPFLGTWPRLRKKILDVPRWPWLAPAGDRETLAQFYRELIRCHREREEMARTFGDDEEYVPRLLSPTPPAEGAAAPAVMTATSGWPYWQIWDDTPSYLFVNPIPTDTYSSLPYAHDVYQNLGSMAVHIRHPQDSLDTRPPACVSSSQSSRKAARKSLSKALPIVRPNDRSVVVPPPLSRAISFTGAADRVLRGQTGRRTREQATGLVQLTPQSQANVTSLSPTSRRATEPQGSQETSGGVVAPQRGFCFDGEEDAGPYSQEW